MSADSFLYFAYGSNMFTPWLCQPTRCPSARAVGIAELRGHELRWHKALAVDENPASYIRARNIEDLMEHC
ncbi:gamma-glutamylcyclotransferase family protein [Sphingobium fluviale]|uniref:gamma-glutamylcyclotransferase family protein n=1 Tax=Sphingobium fluviale TaxID=2506423 RepID=UPI0015F2DD61|nr:gamma-glutamylcyclotransferase family protein [Sphingobium fluviale]